MEGRQKCVRTRNEDISCTLKITSGKRFHVDRFLHFNVLPTLIAKAPVGSSTRNESLHSIFFKDAGALSNHLICYQPGTCQCLFSLLLAKRSKQNKTKQMDCKHNNSRQLRSYVKRGPSTQNKGRQGHCYDRKRSNNYTWPYKMVL